MKVAHLILAHNNPVQLERLVDCLSHRDADIYIHLDKKTEIAPFDHLKDRPNLFFVDKRIKVYWGSYNIVEATLSGFRQIIESKKKYQFVNLLSGQDYPIQSRQDIHRFLKDNTGVAFMNFLPFEPDWLEALPRIRAYHFNNFRLPGRYILQSIVNKVLPERIFPYGMTPVGRSQWFTIPPECVKYIIDYWDGHPKFRRFIKLTWAPDEFIFQTILYNSVHKDKMVNNDLRYIDWSQGGVSPKTLTMDDADALLASGKLYARKFDLNKDAGVLDFIDANNRANKASTTL